MDTQLLRTFLEVSKTRHFGHAAESLHVTSAAVSARIRQLEEFLNVTLFTRQRGNIQLTDAGQRLLPHAESILSVWATVKQEMATEQTPPDVIKLGYQTGLIPQVCPINTSALSAQPVLPLTDMLTITAATSSALLEGLMQTQFDLILTSDAIHDEQLIKQVVGELRCDLFSDQPEQSWLEMTRSTYVHIDWGDDFAAFHATHFKRSLSVSRLCVDAVSVACDHVTQYGGSAYLPPDLGASLGLYAVQAAPQFSQPIQVVYQAERFDQARLEKLIAQVFKTF